MKHRTPKELYKALVEQVGLKKSYASMLANRKKTPSLELAIQIERELGIPSSFWAAEQESTAA